MKKTAASIALTLAMFGTAPAFAADDQPSDQPSDAPVAALYSTDNTDTAAPDDSATAEPMLLGAEEDPSAVAADDAAAADDTAAAGESRMVTLAAPASATVGQPSGPGTAASWGILAVVVAAAGALGLRLRRHA